MDHTFTQSGLDKSKCAKCKRAFADHTDFASCDACSYIGIVEIWADMILCPACIQKEKDAVAAHQDAKLQEKRLAEHKASEAVLNIQNLTDKARSLDYAIQVRQDVHNAKTIATYEVFKAIDENPDINNKQYEKAKFLNDRYVALSEAIFDREEKNAEDRTEQRVMQQEMNKLANSLREEERAKLAILSPNYKPGKVKSAKEQRPRAVAKKPKYDKGELIKETAQLQKEGFSWIQLSNLQGICVQRDMTPAQAANVVRKMSEV